MTAQQFIKKADKITRSSSDDYTEARQELVSLFDDVAGCRDYDSTIKIAKLLNSTVTAPNGDLLNK